MEYSGHVCSPRIPHGCIYLGRTKTWKGGGGCSLYLCTVNWFGICDDERLLGEELHCKWSMLQRQMDVQCLPGRIWLNDLSRRAYTMESKTTTKITTKQTNSHFATDRLSFRIWLTGQLSWALASMVEENTVRNPGKWVLCSGTARTKQREYRYIRQYDSMWEAWWSIN